MAAKVPKNASDRPPDHRFRAGIHSGSNRTPITCRVMTSGPTENGCNDTKNTDTDATQVLRCRCLLLQSTPRSRPLLKSSRMAVAVSLMSALRFRSFPPLGGTKNRAPVATRGIWEPLLAVLQPNLQGEAARSAIHHGARFYPLPVWYLGGSPSSQPRACSELRPRSGSIASTATSFSDSQAPHR